MSRNLIEVALGLDKNPLMKGLASVEKRFGKLTGSLSKGFKNLGKSLGSLTLAGAGVVGAGMGLKAWIEPAREMKNALGEVASLGVAGSALDMLGDKALDIAAKFGGSAPDVVRSAYDIQSAIAGLTGEELSQFTDAAATLAVGTKASTGEITSYFGTMYGIFKTQADEMGKGQWVENLTGMTAKAVQQFKTTGAEMSGAFSSLGAEAAASGLSLESQIGILGTLQATMSGSEAGTKYRAFLKGVGKAQDSLGLSFTDAQGKMLPTVEILERISGKFGDIDTVAESDALQKAFGSSQAVGFIKLLSADVDGLKGSIDAVGESKGMDLAGKMAADIADPIDGLGGSLYRMMMGFREVSYNAIQPWIDKLTGAVDTVHEFSKEYEGITKLIGLAVPAFILGGAGLFALAMGAKAVGLAMVTLTSPFALIIAGGIALGVGLYYLEQKTGAVSKAWEYLAGVGSEAWAVLEPQLVGLKDVAMEVWDAMMGLFDTAGDSGLGEFVPSIETMGKIVGGVLDLAILQPLRFIGDILESVFKLAGTVIDLFDKGFSIETLSAFGGALLDLVLNPLQGFFNDSIVGKWIMEQASGLFDSEPAVATTSTAQIEKSAALQRVVGEGRVDNSTSSTSSTQINVYSRDRDLGSQFRDLARRRG